MKILAIETSCDETAISIVEVRGEDTPQLSVLANIVHSQIDIHKEYGGVYPSLAKREHAKNLVPVLLQAFDKADIVEDASSVDIDESVQEEIRELFTREPGLADAFFASLSRIIPAKFDLIAVTNRPGLEPALWVGINFAKALSRLWGTPVIGINHMEGHIVSALFEKETIRPIKYPALALLISGGHTEFILIKEPLQYELVGGTRDDAVGEAFDKAARMLGLSYPGGPEIARMAKMCPHQPGEPLPRPMIDSPDLDFSFSGLKTAVLYRTRKTTEMTDEIRAEISRAFEDAVADVLLKKTHDAVNVFDIRTVILGGGVTANETIRLRFREAFGEMPETELIIPEFSLTTDNALMIALAGYLRATAQPNEVRTQWPDISDLRAQGNAELGKDLA